MATKKVTPIRRKPETDPLARHLWRVVARLDERIRRTVDQIPSDAVAGMATRAELHRAALLMAKAAALLRRTAEREGERVGRLQAYSV